jgi:hypothetical protein
MAGAFFFVAGIRPFAFPARTKALDRCPVATFGPSK